MAKQVSILVLMDFASEVDGSIPEPEHLKVSILVLMDFASEGVL